MAGPPPLQPLSICTDLIRHKDENGRESTREGGEHGRRGLITTMSLSSASYSADSEGNNAKGGVVVHGTLDPPSRPSRTTQGLGSDVISPSQHLFISYILFNKFQIKLFLQYEILVCHYILKLKKLP